MKGNKTGIICMSHPQEAWVFLFHTGRTGLDSTMHLSGSQPTGWKAHWRRETKLSQNLLGITDPSSLCKPHCLKVLSHAVFWIPPFVRGNEQHAALGVKGMPDTQLGLPLGLRNTSVYQFKRVTLSHHWSPASHTNLICSSLWHRSHIVGIRAGCGFRALPMHITALHLSGSSSCLGFVSTVHHVFRDQNLESKAPLWNAPMLTPTPFR